MIQSKQKVKDLCDKLMDVNPMQIIIDLVQDDIEELVYSDNTTPDDIGAATYYGSILKDCYNPELKSDIDYLIALQMALETWEGDLRLADKILGLDPNK